MRTLTPEEKELWEKAMAKTEATPHNVAAPYLPPRKRPQVMPLRFMRVLDLHHYTVQGAYDAVQAHILTAHVEKCKSIQHITGRSGQIAREYQRWVKDNPLVRKIQEQNGGGAWTLWLKK